MTTKTTKKTATKKTAQAQAQAVQHNVILEALQARKGSILQYCDAVAVNSQIKQLDPVIKRADDKVMQFAADTMQQTDFVAVAQTIAAFDAEKRQGKEQVKTIVKIIDVIVNIAQGIKAESNNFNDCIRAMLANGNSANISEMVIAQSGKARETMQHKAREGFNARSSAYTIGTGSSQASQVRQVLRVLNFATANKGKKDDVCELTQYGREMLERAYR